MIIQVDTREQKNKEVIEAFEMASIKHFSSKLFTGDYIDFERPKVVIDLKKDLLELAGNLTKQHDRFRREVERARMLGLEFIVLIREPLESIEKVKNWANKRSSVSGETLYKIMQTMGERYGIIWKFCNRSDAGFRIIEMLRR